MVDVVRCKNGHYYDHQTYQECPHCASGWLDNDNTIEYKTKVAFLAQQYVEQYVKIEKTTGVRTGYPSIAGTSASSVQPIQSQNTPLIQNVQLVQNKQLTQDAQSVYQTQTTQNTPTISGQSMTAATGNNVTEENSKSIIPPVAPSSPYKEDMKTTSFATGSENNYLVTGWIVCIDGPDEGYSYNLHYGYNTIGCGLENQICLSKETGASEATHCSIVYEDHKNQFYLLTEPEQTVYLNGECESKPMRLVNGDLICVGEDVFELVTFCRGERKWKKKNRKEDT